MQPAPTPAVRDARALPVDVFARYDAYCRIAAVCRVLAADTDVCADPALGGTFAAVFVMADDAATAHRQLLHALGFDGEPVPEDAVVEIDGERSPLPNVAVEVLRELIQTALEAATLSEEEPMHEIETTATATATDGVDAAERTTQRIPLRTGRSPAAPATAAPVTPASAQEEQSPGVIRRALGTVGTFVMGTVTHIIDEARTRPVRTGLIAVGMLAACYVIGAVYDGVRDGLASDATVTS